MPDLVRNHIGLGELARLAADIASAEASLEILKETCVEVNFLIKGAIERTHSRLRKPATRPGCSGKHDQRWRLVLFPSLSENVGPFRLCATKNRGDEPTHSIGRSAWFGRRLLLGLTGFRQHVGALNEDARIDTQCPTDETEYDDRADPDSAAARSGKAAAPSTTPVFNSVALGQLIKPHDLPRHHAGSLFTSICDSSATVGTRPCGVSLSTTPSRICESCLVTSSSDGPERCASVLIMTGPSAEPS
jgi:hypothetical protein